MLISPEKLQKVVEAVLMGGGSEPQEAEIVASHLVRANLTGHDSHGVGMVPAYVFIQHMGNLKPNTSVKLVKDDGAILRFDGGRGYGQIVAREAMEQTIARAKETGIALMALANAHHVGRVGTYGEQALKAGMVSLHFVNVVDHSPLVAPFRGTDSRYGTNPICIAVPGGHKTEDILLDMATSKVALGKVRVAMNKGEEVEPDTLLDKAGQPTNDPSVMFEEPRGALLAIGAHKGYGLAFMAEVLAGVLTGGGTIQPGNERHNSIINHMFAIVIDPSRLGDRDWMRAEIDAMVDYFKASPEQVPGEPVLSPGDPERISEAERRANGIEIDDKTWSEIVEVANANGVSAEQIAGMVGMKKPREGFP